VDKEDPVICAIILLAFCNITRPIQNSTKNSHCSRLQGRGMALLRSTIIMTATFVPIQGDLTNLLS